MYHMNESNDERWLPIAWFDSYEVSSLGRVRKIGGRTRRAQPDRGYPGVTLYRNGKPFRRLVHALVAEAFIGPRPDGFEIDHKDFDKLNNRVDNLEYVTPKENTRRAIAARRQERPSGPNHWTHKKPWLRLFGLANPSAKLTPEQVRGIREMRASGATLRAVAARYEVSVTTVAKVAKGIFWAAVK